MSREAFAETLRQARGRTGLRQDELAQKLDRRQSAVSNWEGGVSVPEAEDVFRIEAVLGLDPGTLSQHLGYLPVEEAGPNVEAAIRADEHLTPDGREVLVTLYWQLRAGSERRPSPARRPGRS